MGVGCRRCFYQWSISHRWLAPLVSRWSRSLSSTTPTLILSGSPSDTDPKTTTTTGSYLQQQQLPVTGGDRRRRAGAVVAPKLLLSSPAQPERRFIYDFTPDNNLIVKKAEVELPATANHFLIGSSQGYLFSIPNEPTPNYILAVDPLTGHRLELPPITLLPQITSYSNSNGCNVKPGSPAPDIRFLDWAYSRLYGSKAVLSPSLDFLVLLRHGEPYFARVGEVHAWTLLEIPTGGLLADCFFHNGRLHAVNHLGSTFVYDLNGPHPSWPIRCSLTSISYPLAQDKDFQLGLNRYFLVSPDGRDLFFVLRGVFPIERESYDFEDDDRCNWIRMLPWLPDEPPFRAKHFRVFKFFEASRRWGRVHSLGGLAMFVGPGETMSLSTSNFPSGVLEPDCVYFTDDHRSKYWFQPQVVGDTGVFNLKDRSIRFCELADGELQLNWPPPLWFVPTT